MAHRYLMKIRILILSLAACVMIGSSQFTDKPAYALYDRNGDNVTYSELLKLSEDHQITFFGELHDNAIGHWLQLELIRDLTFDTSRSIQVGMEMFESDQQALIDEYFDGLISQNSFESEARLWNNYETDYKPILEFARTNELDLIATNIPRRYASAVYMNGMDVLDSLSTDSKKWIPPLPIEVDKDLPRYKDILEAAHGHGGDNLIYSQAVKDATMAHFILSNLDNNSRFIHLNGSYHSNNYEGIVWYVKQAENQLKILTINTITADDVANIDKKELEAADITLVVPSRMTTTY